MSDRIDLRWYSTDAGVREAVVAHADLIGDEVLATKMTEMPGPDGDRVMVGDGELWVAITVA